MKRIQAKPPSGIDSLGFEGFGKELELNPFTMGPHEAPETAAYGTVAGGIHRFSRRSQLSRDFRSVVW